MALTAAERAELEQLRAEQGSASSTPAPVAPTGPAPSFGRSAGLAARDVIQGVAGLPGLAIDVMGLPSRLAIKGYEAVTGKETDIGKAPTFNQALDQTMTRAGLPVPVTEGERLASALKQGIVGTVSGTGLGAGLRSAAPTLSRMMTSQPVLQTASAVPASTAAYYAGEAAGDSPYAPLAQIGAGMVGGMTPSAATAFGRKLASPLKISNPPETQRLIGVAEKEGISLTPGTKSGSRPLQAAESVLSTLPFSSGPQRQVYAKTREQFNQAVLKKAGVDAKYVSPEVLENAFTGIGKEFNDLVAQTPPLRVTPEFEANINAAKTEHAKYLTPDQQSVFKAYESDISKAIADAKAVGGTAIIDPKQYKQIASKLRTRIRTTNDPDLKESLGKLQDAFDDLVEQNASSKIVDKWSDARRRYRNLLIIDKAAGGGTGETRISGDIPFAGFKQAVDAADQSGFARGRGEYNDLARVGDLLTQKIPNSGTPERTFMQKVISNPLAAIGTALAGSTVVGTPYVLGGVAAPYGLQKLINSQAGSKYILNQKYAGPNPAAYTKDQAVRNMITALTQYQRPNYEDFTK